MMIWVAASAKHLLGPCFFEGHVNQGTYHIMLQDWFVPQLEHLGLHGHVQIQQDSSLAHYAITMREFLNKVYRDKCIGCELQNLPVPMEWPPRSLDLSSCDNTPWGFIKQKVTQKQYRLNEEFKKLYGTHVLPLLEQCYASSHTAHGDN
jgi:hypothetical protein